MQNMAENVFNRCQRDVCSGGGEVTKNFLGQICTTVSGLNLFLLKVLPYFFYIFFLTTFVEQLGDDGKWYVQLAVVCH